MTSPMPGSSVTFLALFTPVRRKVTRPPWDCVKCVNFAGFLLLSVVLATRAEARDSLGIFSDWAAFRDPATPRCYAIAMAQPSALRREFQPYADVGTWPRQQTRGQVHFRLS